jgi:hypothetical protein
MEKELEKQRKLEDKRRRLLFPTITIVCDYNDENYLAEGQEDPMSVKNKRERTPPPPPEIPAGKFRGGAAPISTAFKEIYNPKPKLAMVPKYNAEGLLTMTHDFRTGPLKVSRLKHVMFSKSQTTGVEWVGLQPHVKAVVMEGDIVDYDIYGNVVAKTDPRDDPFYINNLQFGERGLDFTEENRHLLREDVIYRVVFDDTKRDLFMSVNIKFKRQYKELFDAIDDECGDGRGTLTLDQIIEYYATIGSKQLVMYTEMYGTDLAAISAKMDTEQRLNAVLVELINMRKEENRGTTVHFQDFLVIQAKARAMLFETDPSAKHRQASVAFPFSAMTSLEPPKPEVLDLEPTAMKAEEIAERTRSETSTSRPNAQRKKK